MYWYCSMRLYNTCMPSACMPSRGWRSRCIEAHPDTQTWMHFLVVRSHSLGFGDRVNFEKLPSICSEVFQNSLHRQTNEPQMHQQQKVRSSNASRGSSNTRVCTRVHTTCILYYFAGSMVLTILYQVSIPRYVSQTINGRNATRKII